MNETTTVAEATEAPETVIIYETVDITPIIDNMGVIIVNHHNQTGVMLVLVGCVIASVISIVIAGLFK